MYMRVNKVLGSFLLRFRFLTFEVSKTYLIYPVAQCVFVRYKPGKKGEIRKSPGVQLRGCSRKYGLQMRSEVPFLAWGTLFESLGQAFLYGLGSRQCTFSFTHEPLLWCAMLYTRSLFLTTSTCHSFLY